MAFSNPFDDPQGAFYILRNAQGQFSLWPQQCALPAGWDIVCQPQSQASCQQWLEVHWRTLTPANFTQLQEEQ
ncbi:enterobactin biosynthesis protein YbdZ [Escherichia coli]|nr:enterobactin biosynthesis protein YbdZ [Escherichia coli]EKA1142344.1 enterobactin biosynthesis protein YbdZ [Escherichia coli]EKI8620981.1 enterobactin biosynthesis protein YbdZ [Escherichia coli]